MLARSAGKLSRGCATRLGSRAKHSKAPRRVDMEHMKEKYGKMAYLFNKDLPTQIKYYDAYDKHKQLVQFSYVDKFHPKVETESFIAPNATVSGNVEIWARSSIWYGVTIRGDTNLIRIGDTTNVQDNTTITEALGELHSDHDGSTIIGHNVTIGHSCHLSACTVEDNCFIGMRSVLCPDSYMEEGSMLAANSVLHSRARIPSGELWAGNPARKMRDLTAEELTSIKDGAYRYWLLAQDHAEEFYLPTGTNYIEAEKIDPEIGFRIWDDPFAPKKGSL